MRWIVYNSPGLPTCIKGKACWCQRQQAIKTVCVTRWASNRAVTPVANKTQGAGCLTGRPARTMRDNPRQLVVFCHVMSHSMGPFVTKRREIQFLLLMNNKFPVTVQHIKFISSKNSANPCWLGLDQQFVLPTFISTACSKQLAFQPVPLGLSSVIGH